ncbi:MAG: 16S rRNA (cytosine(1402)-N(4))-methyltransferase RsmH [Patescibacteria group bacterium]
MIHTPVFLKEAMEILNPQKGEFFIDGTIDGGGHAAEISKRIGPDGKLLGIDWDEKMIEDCRSRLAGFKNLILRCGNYADLPEMLKNEKADGLFLDLGFSSEQLEKSGRGFSFLRNEPLDMRYSRKTEQTAAAIINSFNEKDLADIFWKYGEERHSRRIAKAIVAQRKKKRILTTFDLTGVIGEAAPRSFGKTKINPATKVFQALRIYVNSELDNLEKVLNKLNRILKSKGRVGIISFHSLEDRIVKNYFRKLAKDGKAEILTKKPVRPSAEEIKENPRSRSAKLRVLKIL